MITYVSSLFDNIFDLTTVAHRYMDEINVHALRAGDVPNS